MNNLKVLNTEIQNFKNLSSKVVDIHGESMVVVGSNDKGKSSFIQAMMSPFLDTYKPLEPIKEGEERGSVAITIGGDLDGEKVEYLVEMYFSQEHQKGRLKLTDADGTVITGAKSALEAIIGDISFDVDRFLALAKTPSGKQSKEGAKRQIDMLKDFLPIEIQKQLQQCDIDRKDVFSTRAELNTEIKILEGKNSHEFTDEDLEKYSEVKSEEEVTKKLADIGEAIENWSRIKKGVDDAEDKMNKNEVLINSKKYITDSRDVVQNCIDSLEGKKDQETVTFLAHCHKYKSIQTDNLTVITEAEKEQIELSKKIQGGSSWLTKNPNKPTTEALLLEQKKIQDFNVKAKQVAQMKVNHQEIIDKKKKSEEMTATISSYIQKKKDIFSENPLPVNGLTFDEDQVLYKGLIFNETTQPASTIIGVGVQIAMAMNPNLKIIIIKDGSLLDKELFKKILGMVEKRGYQLFIEMVDWKGSELDVKFAEKFIE